MEGTDNAKPVREWVAARRDARAAGDFPAHALDQSAFILAPAGAYGPVFLALENFLVIKRYNMSDLYALFVGNLGDRIAGGGDFVVPWANVQQLSAKSIEAIQEGLQAKGYAVAKVDGKAGMNTRALVGAYQKANGLKLDCWPAERAAQSHARQGAGQGSAAQRRRRRQGGRPRT